VLLFLQGGPTQLETWDPKPDAPREYRTIVDCVPTALPGVCFSSYFPKMAAAARGLAVVRSFASGNGGHTYDPVTTGGNRAKASMSAVYAHLAGTINPHSGLPTNVLVLPEAVQEGLKLGSNFETGALPTLTQPGLLGPQYEAFSPAGGSQLKRSMTLTLPRERFDDRRLLLREFDGLRRDLDRGGRLERVDKYRRQAFDIISRGITDAFDLGKEDPKTVARYDTSGLFRLEEPAKWFDMRRASNLLGKQMLLARRLVEAGCGFITVSDCGWDMHANENSPKNMGGLKWLAPQVDHAVAAFLEDVQQRGLSERVLLVITGEMDRSPRLNPNGGREHHGDLTNRATTPGWRQTGGGPTSGWRPCELRWEREGRRSQVTRRARASWPASARNTPRTPTSAAIWPPATTAWAACCGAWAGGRRRRRRTRRPSPSGSSWPATSPPCPDTARTWPRATATWASCFTTWAGCPRRRRRTRTPWPSGGSWPATSPPCPDTARTWPRATTI
jgi:hypothetical protein